MFRAITVSKEDRPSAWEVSETDEERGLKLRRLALLQLFNAIGLHPLRSSASSRSREALIQAVQLPDKMARSSSQSGTEEEEEGEEVAEDTLNALYKKAQRYDPDMPTMDPPDTFKFELRKYQKQALCWMVGKERGPEGEVRKQKSLNPLWEEYEWPKDDADGKENQDDQVEIDEKFYLNPYSGEMSLIFPTYEAVTRGGILADGNIP